MKKRITLSQARKAAKAAMEYLKKYPPTEKQKKKIRDKYLGKF